MKLVHQITAAMLTTLMLVVALVAASLYFSVERGFSRHVRGLEEARLQPAVQRLTRFYEREGTWDSLVRDPRRFAMMLRREDSDDPPPGPPRAEPFNDPPDRPPPRERGEPPEGPPDRPPPRPPREPSKADTDPLELPHRVSLYDSQRHRLLGEGSLDSDASQIRLEVKGKTVGWLGVRAIPQLEASLDVQYLHQIREQIIVIAATATLLGVLAGWLLARRLARPIESLRTAARQLATGDYEKRILVRGSQELVQLATDFNRLAATLAADERARRQWVADTSHELRTPITVLRAEVEAMLDGVRPIDDAAIHSLHAELLRLGKLVEDLGELARADQGALAMTRTPLEPVALLRDSIGVFRGRFERKRISLETDLAEVESARILGDRDRIQQIFANLLENSARYTNEGGVLRVSGQILGDRLGLRFDDSAPPVPPQALPHLFDRFYRAEASRSREFGGSGLGLSICQRLVEAHGGGIEASASPLGGVRIELQLPLLSTDRPSQPTPSKAAR